MKFTIKEYIQKGSTWKLLKWSTWKSLWQKRPSLAIKSAAIVIQELASALMKLGTLALVIILIIWLWRSIHNEGYVIEPFNVPKHLMESGYDGVVVARKIQDAVVNLKEEARSVKTDSLNLLGNEAVDMDIAVLSIGISLRSLTQRLRELLGRKNYFIRGEITHLDSTYQLTLRMTDVEPLVYQVPVKNNQQGAAVQQLLRFGGEGILLNTDPYRLALICYKSKRYKDAMKAIRLILKNRPDEAHWAYLAWGNILKQQENIEGAIIKYEKAIKIKPNFESAWINLAWAYNGEDRKEEGIAAMYNALASSPNNIERLQNTAWFLHANEQYEAADSLFKKMTELEPNNAFAWMTWADSKFNRKEVEEAIRLVEKSKAYIGESSEGSLIMAFSSFIQQDTVEAIRHAQTAMDLNPAYSAAVSSLMSGHYIMDNHDEIIKIGYQADWENMKSDLYQKQRAMNLWAMSHNMKGKHDTAKKIVKDCIELNKNLGMPYSTLAETFAFQGQVDSFYYYLQVAFEKGLEPRWLDKDVAPYKQFLEDARFLALIEKYRKVRPVKG